MAVDSVLSSPLGPPACEKDAKALQFIEEMTRNAFKVQEKVLGEILCRNGNTEYLKRFKLNGAIDRETFKAKVPMVTYEDLQPEIQRIANGDRSPILSAHPVSEFLTRYSSFLATTPSVLLNLQHFPFLDDNPFFFKNLVHIFKLSFNLVHTIYSLYTPRPVKKDVLFDRKHFFKK